MNILDTGIVLIGFPSCGKSAVGRELARRLGREFIDTDAALAAEFARVQGHTLPVREIFRTVGEQAFRKLETRTLRALARTRGGTGAVVATGGGVPLRAENVPILAELGRIVYLYAPVATCLERMDGGKGRPVFLKDRADAERLWAERDAVYRRVADLVAAAGAGTVEQVAAVVLRKIEE